MLRCQIVATSTSTGTAVLGHVLPTNRQAVDLDDAFMTHPQFVEALRGIQGLVDVTGGQTDRPNFHLRKKPFLHFHIDHTSGGVYADVKLGGGPMADFEPVWASTPDEREELLRRVLKHARRATRH
jgi:hypothetical protein